MEETIKSLADLPQLIREQAQEQNNQEAQNNQHQEQKKHVSKYAAKQQRRKPLPLQSRSGNQLPFLGQPQQHGLDDAEKWATMVHLATSLDNIAARVEGIETRLNALVLPEQPPVDVEELRKNLWDDFAKHASSIVNLVRVALEEQAQDLRTRQQATQKQITDEVTGAHERINNRIGDLVCDVIDTRDLLHELMRRVGDPADTPLASRLREIQYIVKKLENPPDDPKENVPQDHTHWLPRWACQILFGSEEVHVTDHGVWTETRVGDKVDFGGSSLFDLWKKIRSAKAAYRVQQKIQKLQEQLNQNPAAK